MFGPIPTYDPFLGDPLPLDNNNIPTNTNNNNPDNTMMESDDDLTGDLPDQPTFENMNRAAL